ncbi:MAG: glycosyltransferase [Gammaproteobacteria bacterium]|nr:glycosyltransferase [Gammaproteobacteria bacterium]
MTRSVDVIDKAAEKVTREVTAGVSVDICVATFRRPGLLRTLLDSLNRQELSPKMVIRIIVVDNDIAESAKDAVKEFSSVSLWPIIYDVQSEQNIALTRNRALSLSNADFVAFIDDDEFAEPCWLQHLVDSAKGTSAAAVFGPVLPVLPANAPDWIQKGRFFEPPRYATGADMRVGATRNALVAKSWIRKWSTPFDSAFGLTGGEDTEFFDRIYKAGGRLAWCDEAMVYEHVGMDRVNLGYLLRRAFRSGQSYARIFNKDSAFPVRVARLVYRGILLLVALVLSSFGWMFGKELGAKALVKVCANFGQISASFGSRYEQYRCTVG